MDTSGHMVGESDEKEVDGLETNGGLERISIGFGVKGDVAAAMAAGG